MNNRHVGYFGRAFLESLQENRPDAYRALKQDGSLNASAQAIEERALQQYLQLLADLQQRHPPPKHLPYPQRVQYLNGLAQQAREIVLSEVVVLSEDENPASQDPYSSGSPPPLSQ